MRIFAALLFVVGCSKHSQHELDQAGHDLNSAAHHAAQAVTSSAAEDEDELARDLHDVDVKLKNATGHAADVLKRQREELETKLSAIRGSASDSSKTSPPPSP